MKQTLKLSALFLGALALSFTLATADGKCGEGKCGDAQKTTKTAPKKCQAGKCASGKCGNATKGTNTNLHLPKENVVKVNVDNLPTTTTSSFS